MDKFKFTQKGLEYIAQTTDGCTVVFTKGKYGDGSPPIDILSLTDLVSVKGDLTLVSENVDGNQVTVKTSFSNVQSDGTIAESFYLREMGLFGTLLSSSGSVQGTETLLLYACATGSDSGDYISQNSPTEFVINFPFTVSNADNVSVSVDLDAYALNSDMETAKSQISDLQNEMDDATDWIAAFANMGGTAPAYTTLAEIADGIDGNASDIAALKTGAGLNDGAITVDKIADSVGIIRKISAATDAVACSNVYYVTKNTSDYMPVNGHGFITTVFDEYDITDDGSSNFHLVAVDLETGYIYVGISGTDSSDSTPFTSSISWTKVTHSHSNMSALNAITSTTISSLISRLNALTDTCYLTVTVITADDADTSYGKIKYSVSGTWNDDTAAVVSQDTEDYQEIDEDLGARIYFIKDADTHALSCRLECAGTSGYTNEPSDTYIDISGDYMSTGTHVYTYTFKKEH